MWCLVFNYIMISSSIIWIIKVCVIDNDFHFQYDIRTHNDFVWYLFMPSIPIRPVLSALLSKQFPLFNKKVFLLHKPCSFSNNRSQKWPPTCLSWVWLPKSWWVCPRGSIPSSTCATFCFAFWQSAKRLEKPLLTNIHLHAGCHALCLHLLEVCWLILC